jgi:hypothetical protein
VSVGFSKGLSSAVSQNRTVFEKFVREQGLWFSYKEGCICKFLVKKGCLQRFLREKIFVRFYLRERNCLFLSKTGLCWLVSQRKRLSSTVHQRKWAVFKFLRWDCIRVSNFCIKGRRWDCFLVKEGCVCKFLKDVGCVCLFLVKRAVFVGFSEKCRFLVDV